MAELTDLQKDLLTLAAEIKRLETEYERTAGQARSRSRVRVPCGREGWEVNFTVRGLKGGGT